MTRTAALRVALVADLREEGWPSMDLVADMLASHLPRAVPGLSVTTLRAPFRSRARWMARGGGAALDRYANRFFDYPRWLRSHRGDYDVFHVLDHSYAHLLHALPASQTIVTCHDVDAFAPFIDGHETPSRLPRWLARRVLDGLRLARLVVCVSEATRSQVERHALVHADRLRVVPNGVDPHCAGEPDPVAEAAADALLGAGREADLLHVGSTIARKRIDVLLAVFAGVAAGVPSARLVRVGGPLTGPQRELAERLGVAARIVEIPFVSRAVLAAIYRRAALLLLPSEREGFGLPVVEAMAAGTPVVVSDIPSLREVGGEAAVYCPVDAVPAWTAVVTALLAERTHRPAERTARVARGRAHASRWSWPAVASELGGLYAALVR